MLNFRQILNFILFLFPFIVASGQEMEKKLNYSQYPFDYSYLNSIPLNSGESWLEPTFFFDFRTSKSKLLSAQRDLTDSIPRSMISFFSGANKQQLVDLSLSRFYKKSLRFSFDFNSVKSNGFYSNQASKMNDVSFDVQYLDTAKVINWKLKANILRSQRENNGGLNRSLYTSSLANDYSIPILNESNSIKRANSLEGNLSYRLSKASNQASLKLMFDFGYNEYFYSYSDLSPDSGYYGVLYDKSIYSTIADRWRIKEFKETVSLIKLGSIGKYKLISGVGLAYSNYSLWQSTKELASNGNAALNVELIDSLTQIRLQSIYYITGYNAGDYMNTAVFKRNTKRFVINLGANYSSVRPSMNYSLFNTAFYSFDGALSNTQRYGLSAGLESKKSKVSVSLKLYNVKGFTLWNSDFSVVQDSSWNLYPSLSLKANEIKLFAGFFTSMNLTLQHFRNELLELPGIVSQSSLFYKRHIVANKSNFLIGVRHNYFTQSKAMGYNPYINNFYLNKAVTIGNYNLFDLYTSITIGPVSVNLNVNHINKGYSGLNYFILDNYLQQGRNIQLGVVWNFID